MLARLRQAHAQRITVPMTPKGAAWILLRSRQALLLGSSVLSAIWAWRYQGLFRIFADTAIRWTGSYDPFFALLFTFLTLFVASMALGAVLTSLMRRRFSKDEWQTLLYDTTALLDSPWRKKRDAEWTRARGICSVRYYGVADVKPDRQPLRRSGQQASIVGHRSATHANG